MRLISYKQPNALISLAWLWMCTQPNNDTMHADSLAGGSLTGGSLARKTEKGTERTLENRRVTWLSHKTKTRGSVGGDGIRARREALMPADAWRDRRACIGRTWSAATTWSCDEEECYMTYLPLRGCITI
jgi:hypothetical protein